MKLIQTAVGMGLATIICVSHPCVGLSQTPTPTPAVHDDSPGGGEPPPDLGSPRLAAAAG